MPNQRATTSLGPNGECDRCGTPHVNARGRITCAGHKRWEYHGDGTRDEIPAELRPPCGRPPRAGLTRCRVHGAGNAGSTDKRDRIAGEESAERALRRFGEPIDTTPTEALLDTVKWTAGYVAWLRDKVASARFDLALTQRSTQTGKREESPWVDLLGKWSDRLVKVCEVAIRAGIEERRVRIAEQQGALVADVIRKILADLHLTPEQAERAGTIVPEKLRLLAS